MKLLLFFFACTIGSTLAALKEPKCNCCESCCKNNETAFGKKFDLNAYHSYSENMAYLDSLPDKYKDNVTIQDIAHTFERRRLVLVRLSSDKNAQRDIIFINCGIHAREWAAPVACMALIDHLLNGSFLLEKFDWYIMPLVNPDGYEYSRTDDRQWRKNRSVSRKNKKCKGVDLNRNFDFHWGSTGASKDPCDHDLYMGPKPFSEIESRAIKKILTAFRKRILLFSSIHTYGESLMIPYGYDKTVLPVNWRQMKVLAQIMARAIKKVAKHKYVVMNAGKLYEAAGDAEDYAAGVLNITHAIIFELTNRYEFEYPENLLNISNSEVISAFTAAAKYLYKHPTKLTDSKYFG